MLRRFSADFAIFSILVDAFLVVTGLKAASYVGQYLHRYIPVLKEYSVSVSIPTIVFLVVAVIWVGMLLLRSTYDARQNFRAVDEFTNLLIGSGTAVISIAGFLYLTYRELPRSMVVLFFCVTVTLLVLVRVIYRLVFRIKTFSAAHKRKVLIIGCSPLGRQLGHQIRSYSQIGLDLIGFLTHEEGCDLQQGTILGGLDQTRQVVLGRDIDDVILALPRNASQRVNQIVAELHDLPVKVWVAPDYYSIALTRASIEDFAGIAMIDLRAPALNDYQRMVKRSLDVLICLLLMPFVLPLMGIVALAIKLDSPGPVLFRQRRMGENGRLFVMYKFRSMVLNADRDRAVLETTERGKIYPDKRKNDPRITRVGATIRRTSLDELPQLFNVLKGEMSLVGPRPELPYLVEQYEPWQRKRFAVPQGITGWWQINGRSDKPMFLHSDEDLYYVQNYSVWLDLQILFKTIFIVLTRRGAY